MNLLSSGFCSLDDRLLPPADLFSRVLSGCPQGLCKCHTFKGNIFRVCSSPLRNSIPVWKASGYFWERCFYFLHDVLRFTLRGEVPRAFRWNEVRCSLLWKPQECGWLWQQKSPFSGEEILCVLWEKNLCLGLVVFLFHLIGTYCAQPAASFLVESFWLNQSHYIYDHQMLWKSYSIGNNNKVPGHRHKCLLHWPVHTWAVITRILIVIINNIYVTLCIMHHSMHFMWHWFVQSCPYALDHTT